MDKNCLFTQINEYLHVQHLPNLTGPSDQILTHPHPYPTLSVHDQITQSAW